MRRTPLTSTPRRQPKLGGDISRLEYNLSFSQIADEQSHRDNINIHSALFIKLSIKHCHVTVY